MAPTGDGKPETLHTEVRRLLAAQVVKELILPSLPAIAQAFQAHLNRKNPLPDLTPANKMLDLLMMFIRKGLLVDDELDADALGVFADMETYLGQRPGSTPDAPSPIRPAGDGEDDLGTESGERAGGS